MNTTSQYERNLRAAFRIVAEYGAGNPDWSLIDEDDPFHGARSVDDIHVMLLRMTQDEVAGFVPGTAAYATAFTNDMAFDSPIVGGRSGFAKLAAVGVCMAATGGWCASALVASVGVGAEQRIRDDGWSKETARAIFLDGVLSGAGGLSAFKGLLPLSVTASWLDLFACPLVTCVPNADRWSR